MIFLTQAIRVNDVDAVPPLTRAQVWEGLVSKAHNALPFVVSMTDCTIINHLSDTEFDRRIVVRGEPHTERITLQEPTRVVFTRLAGPVRGVISNEIIGDEQDLQLRFSFALVISSLEPDSAEESAYAEGMGKDYLAAVASTLDAIRRSVATSHAGPDRSPSR